MSSKKEERLPFKKRMILREANKAMKSKSYVDEDLSYPSAPMLSIAEVQFLNQEVLQKSDQFKSKCPVHELQTTGFSNKNTSQVSNR